ncbi:putative ATP-dependent helicase [Hirsutella rhossiliensis]|uniref:ATP-dependent helicase n=1 Tax=Hirsutella rhossiliensis TaxID=111463 RepID=A0A9P8MUX8_9HYPO|nr:putative ATP-dependent helicase [Hirsutella rhossiliensis]KAH0961599.1 putative ATP-dependent helicase [Hirsutella rhossiliensis]
MNGGDCTKRPGAGFAFKPRNTLSFPNTPSSLDTSSTESALVRQKIEAMVKERAPPKGPSPLQPAPAARANESQRERSPDEDFDITAAVRDLSSVKGKYRGGPADGAGSSALTSHPTFGHPTKMVSSLKQKADVFIHQKTRPEHHLGTKISGPRPPTYHDRRPPPMPTFSSNTHVAAPSYQGDEVFYTDPTKANADLKALLEGGLDEEEEQDDGEKPVVVLEADKNPDSTQPQQEKTEQKRDVVVGKDGIVDGLKVRLLPHQVEGVNWMRGRELGPVKRGTVPKGGLLADDMGLGKTLQSISLMLKNQKPTTDEKGWKKHFGGLEKTTLVVAPLALIRQWEHEIRDKVAKSHGLKVLVHHGPQRTKNSKDLALYDVVITTYQILVSEHGNSSENKGAGCFGLHWWRVVLDEAHTVKNRNAKATKACYALRSEYRWCLSGTPMQNNLDELQSLVRFLRIRPYDDLKQWKEHIDLPMKNGKGHIAIRRLHSILRCFMKRRTKEILKEEGALHPGGEPPADGTATATEFRHTERNVVTVSTKLPPAERNFYNRLEERADKSMELMMKNKISYANAFTLLLRLRQACNHPKLVEGKLGEDKDALSTGSSQKKQDADIDAVADMFAGMGIVSKSCSICGKDLTSVDVEIGRENCSECHDDLEYFKHHGRPEKDKKKKKKKKKKRKSQKQVSPLKSEADAGERKLKTKEKEDNEQDVEPAAEAQQKQAPRRPRNRNAIIDSDDEDEEAEGSWLVPEGERGDLHLGKAGGEEDENAEGGGDWIGSEDSADDTVDDRDQSNLSGFVVDDETAQEEPGYKSVAEASEDEDSLLSVSAITQKMAAQTLDEVKPATSHASASDCAKSEASGSEADGTEVYSGSDQDSASDSDDELYSAGATPLFASAKIREITRLLQAEAHEHKFIVFSQFTSMLDLVEPFLHKERFRFRRYDGSMKNDEREESLRRLREDKSVRVLLCSLKCGSLGLNLTAATRVIIVEPFWNPFVEEQAIDRVHRLNQTVDVTVYKLTVSETVEERIIDLQEKKRLLAEQTIEGGAKKKAVNLGLKEIIDLFRPGGHHGVVDERPWEDGGEAADERDRARQSMNMLRRKPARQENAVYGRRW